MKAELRDRRDHAAERHDRALARHPTRQGDAFQRQLQAVVDELTTIAKVADVPSSDPVEVARTYRWLGDACVDLGQGRENNLLTRGTQAYRRAEELLAGTVASVEKAKLNFNYGHTLRGLSQGFDIGLLEAAQARYESAMRTFSANRLADLAAVVNDELKAIDPQLRLARMRLELEHGQKRLADLATPIASRRN